MTAVVILNYNGRNFLERFLPSVIAFSNNAIVYVVDNASTDDSLSFLKINYTNSVKIIELSKNYGFAEGYNQGLRQIKADYYLLLNSDVEVTENWLAPLETVLNEDKTIAAVQPKILAEHARNTFEYAGASGGFMDSLGYPLCRGRIYDTVEIDNGQHDTKMDCFWATGAAMLVRSEVYHAVGGLDGDFFAHMEEIDWCWRVKRAGYRVVVEPKSTVFHVGGGTLPKHNPKKTYLNFRNSLVTLLKNEQFSKLLWLFPTRLLLDGVAGLKFALNGKFNDVLMIVFAHWFVFLHIFSILKKRAQTKIAISAIEIAPSTVEIGVVKTVSVWSYFIQGKKRWESLNKM